MRFISEYDSDQEADACEDVVRILARYALRFAEDGSLIEALPVRSREEVSGGYRYAVYAEEMMRCSDFYNGAAYLDTMNGAAEKWCSHGSQKNICRRNLRRLKR